MAQIAITKTYFKGVLGAEEKAKLRITDMCDIQKLITTDLLANLCLLI